MTKYFIVPGLGNSGPEHWQTFFENSGNNFQRIIQEEWDVPDCDDWVATIDQAIAGQDPLTTVLIGHSLGCITIAHWANRYNKKIMGALLVAPTSLNANILKPLRFQLCVAQWMVARSWRNACARVTGYFMVAPTILHVISRVGINPFLWHVPLAMVD